MHSLSNLIQRMPGTADDSICHAVTTTLFCGSPGRMRPLTVLGSQPRSAQSSRSRLCTGCQQKQSGSTPRVETRVAHGTHSIGRAIRCLQLCATTTTTMLVSPSLGSCQYQLVWVALHPTRLVCTTRSVTSRSGCTTTTRDILLLHSVTLVAHSQARCVSHGAAHTQQSSITCAQQTVLPPLPTIGPGSSGSASLRAVPRRGQDAYPHRRLPII